MLSLTWKINEIEKALWEVYFLDYNEKKWIIKVFSDYPPEKQEKLLIILKKYKNIQNELIDKKISEDKNFYFKIQILLKKVLEQVKIRTNTWMKLEELKNQITENKKTENIVLI